MVGIWWKSRKLSQEIDIKDRIEISTFNGKIGSYNYKFLY